MFLAFAVLAGSATTISVTGYSRDLDGSNICRHVLFLPRQYIDSIQPMMGVIGAVIVLIVYLCLRINAGLTDVDNDYFKFWSAVARIHDAIVH